MIAAARGSEGQPRGHRTGAPVEPPDFAGQAASGSNFNETPFMQ